jgi:hypothetical protein
MRPLARSALRAAPPGSAHIQPPRAGLLLADALGQVWLCEAVIRSGEVADYFLVRLSRLDGDEPVGDPVVLSPSEYDLFSRTRRLHPVLI